MCFPISLNPGWPCNLLGPIEYHGNDEVPVLSLSVKRPHPLFFLCLGNSHENVLGLLSCKIEPCGIELNGLSSLMKASREQQTAGSETAKVSSTASLATQTCEQ